MVRVLAVVLSVMFLALGSAYAQQNKPAGWPSGDASEARAGGSLCSVCVSCGGKWSRVAGGIKAENGETLSRGGNCGGSLTLRANFYPFICCKRN